VFEALLSDISKTPQQIVDENSWTLMTDKAAIEEACLRVLANNKQTVCCCTYFCCYLKRRNLSSHMTCSSMPAAVVQRPQQPLAAAV